MVIYVGDNKKNKKVKCKSCGKEFEISSRARFKRKYCPACSKKRKEDYESLWKVKAEDCDEVDGGGGWG